MLYTLIMVTYVYHGWAVATEVFAGSRTQRNALPRDRLKVYVAAIQAGIRCQLGGAWIMVGSWLDHGWIMSERVQ